MKAIKNSVVAALTALLLVGISGPATTAEDGPY